MKNILRTICNVFFIISTAYAGQLEVKFNGKNIKLPYWAAVKNPHGAVVLINGDSQALWPTLLAYMAKQLANHGWSAVLLNCNQDNPEPWSKELPEVINTLRQQKNNRIVLVHYGDQVNQTFDVWNKKGGIEGLVLLSAYDLSQNADKKFELIMPLFDITGQFDYGVVLEQMRERKQEFAHNKYTTIKVPGATHDYEYTRQMLVSFIHGWMLKLREDKPKPPPVLVSYITSIESFLPKELALEDESDWTGFNENPPEPTQEITQPSE